MPDLPSRLRLAAKSWNRLCTGLSARLKPLPSCSRSGSVKLTELYTSAVDCLHRLLLQPPLRLPSDLTSRLCIWPSVSLKPLHICIMAASRNLAVECFCTTSQTGLCIVLSARSGVQQCLPAHIQHFSASCGPHSMSCICRCITRTACIARMYCQDQVLAV